MFTTTCKGTHMLQMGLKNKKKKGTESLDCNGTNITEVTVYTSRITLVQIISDFGLMWSHTS